MTEMPEPPPDDIAHLLRLGLDDDVDVDATMMVTAPAPSTDKGGQSGGGARRWNPPSVEELQHVLPQYDISAFIARGGMGAVYRGSQKTLKRAVAIKVLPPEIDDGDRQFAARFKHEAQAMAQLAHPNIVAVFDAGETPDGLLYFVMEFIEGTDVAQLIASEGIIEPLRAIQITTAVCEALTFAHEEGIIHRDIKPSNIMLDKKGRVKVADFGLAKTLNVENTLVTGSNIAMGTPDFIAPETLITGMKVDQRADIYAVGVMLYQMLTGHIPRGRFELPSGMTPKVDKGFDAVVDKAMQTDREKRYSTALELKTAVERVGSASVPLSSSASQNVPQPEIKVKRGRAPFLLGITAAVLVLGGGIWGLMKKDSKPPPPSTALNSSGGSTASSAGPTASPQPVGQWVKVWKNPEQIPNMGTVTDGWVTTKIGLPSIRIPAFNGRNGGIRARFRRGQENHAPPQLQLRNVGGVGYNIIPVYDALIFRRNDTSAFKVSNVELKKVPLTLPMAGQEFVLEFIAIGRTLIARLNDQTVHVELAAGGHAYLRGCAALYQTDVNAFRDVEIINLDGMPEDEALKLVGVNVQENDMRPNNTVQGFATPIAKPASTYPPGKWVKIWQDPENIPNVGEIANGWARTKAKALSARIPDALVFNGGVRAHFIAAPNGPPPQLFIRQLNNSSSGYNALCYYDGLHIRRNDPTAPMRNVELKMFLTDLPETGKEYVLELIAVGPHLIARLNGKAFQFKLDEPLSEQVPGEMRLFQTDLHSFRDVEVINLDGLSEAEALKIAGMNAAENDVRPTKATQGFATPVPKSATTYPTGQWVKVLQDPGSNPALREISDGWVRTKPEVMLIRIPAAHMLNGGLRARFIANTSVSPPQLILRQKNSSGYNILCKYGGLHIRRNDPTAPIHNIELKTFLSDLPQTGEEYVLELIAVGPHLIARLNGKTFQFKLDEPLTQQDPGEMLLFQTDLHSFRDVEVINLDGLSEAEALKIAGINEPSDSGKWRNLIPLIEPAKHAVNGNWTVRNGELVCKAAAWAFCELPIDYHGGHYDLRYTVTRGEGQRLAMYFPFRKGDTGGDVVFDFFNSSFTDGMKRAGLENLRGCKLSGPGSVFCLQPEWIPQGKKVTVVLQVRDEGIAVSLNDTEVFRWKADWTKIHQYDGFEKDVFTKLNGRPVFGVGLFSCDAIYHSIEMREVSGAEGRSLPPVSAPRVGKAVITPP